MVDGESEIDDDKFFFAPNGKTDAKAELHATLDALFNETRFDDNSSACLFPARKNWLAEKLEIDNFAEVSCKEFDKTLKRLDPKSTTMVFPSAHINSPASMFGHTFLRLNSSYNSKLLSYAVNYAANANADTENGVIFAIKGLFGGYYGHYSLLPYYEKLKEYRDTEQRDIWEYDLSLNEQEILKMVHHIWELNNIYSNYYFFTENCSYNMLWLLEVARPSLHLREEFLYHVTPLETIHVFKEKGIISDVNYRASKRAILLKYDALIKDEYLHFVKDIVKSKISIEDFLNIKEISLQQKRYILEASIEFLEYSFSKNDMKKSEYISLFHSLSKHRASLKKGKELFIKPPHNPINGHRAVRVALGGGVRENEAIGFLNFRVNYHDLEDSNYGFLRGTQIEFFNLELSYTKEEMDLEKMTLLSIVSLAQRSEFFESISWRTKFGWDRDSLEEKADFMATVGAGFSWGNKYGYSYLMLDPLVYFADAFKAGIGGSVGLVIDGYDFMSTNLEYTRRY